MPDDLALAAEAIVRALAEGGPLWHRSAIVLSMRYCAHCGADDQRGLTRHRSDCLWLQSVRWVAARDATPEAAAVPSLARALNMARPHPEAVRE